MSKRFIKPFEDFVNESSQDDPKGARAFINSREFGDILAMGYKLASTERQLKNGTVVLTAPSGKQLFLMGTAQDVRRTSPRPGKPNPLIYSAPRTSSEEFWSNMHDIIVNKIDIDTLTYKKERKAEDRAKLKNIIANHINSLKIDSTLRAILTKRVTYADHNHPEKEIKAAIEKSFFMKDRVLYVRIYDFRLKFAVDKIAQEYSGNQPIVFLWSGHIPAEDVEAVRMTGAQIKLMAEWCGHLWADKKLASLGPIEVYSWVDTSGGSIVNIESSSDLMGKSCTVVGPPLPTGTREPHEINFNSNCTVRLDFEFQDQILVKHLKGVRATVQTSASLNKFLVQEREWQANHPVLAPTEQYSIKFEDLSGNPLDRDHHTDIDLSDEVNDLWN